MSDADSSLSFIPEVSVQDAQAIDRVAAIVCEHLAIMPAKKQVSGHEFTRAVQPKKNLGFRPCHKTPSRRSSLAVLRASVSPWWMFSGVLS